MVPALKDASRPAERVKATFSDNSLTFFSARVSRPWARRKGRFSCPVPYPHSQRSSISKRRPRQFCAHAARDASVLPTLRRLKRFARTTDAEIFSTEIALAEVQFALAMDYGFETWDKLKQRVEASAPPLRLHPPTRWFHGSDRVLDHLRLGATVTPIMEVAKAFAHQPKTVSMQIEETGSQNVRRVRIVHDGQQDGYLYAVAVADPAADLRPHPESTMAPGDEMLTTRELPAQLLEALPVVGSQEQVYEEPLTAKTLKRAGALHLPDPPAAVRPEVNRFPSAYHLALSCCGIPCDYDTVAGDSGLAFIIQADSLHAINGAKRPDELNIGYWPVDQWGALLRLDFLGRVYGRQFIFIREREEEYGRDEAEHFRRYFQQPIVESLQAGRPVLALEHDMYVVTRFDNGNPPLLGQIACAVEREVKRVSRYPWSLVVLGEPVEKIDRLRADAEAIDFAIRLHHDDYGSPMPGKSSGKASFTLWSPLIRNADICGPWFYHANVVNHLRNARSSAVPYLRQMAARHDRKAAEPLRAAAEVHQRVVTKLKGADVSEQAFANTVGREALADIVDEVAALEAHAATYLDQARQAM